MVVFARPGHFRSTFVSPSPETVNVGARDVAMTPTITQEARAYMPLSARL